MTARSSRVFVVVLVSLISHAIVGTMLSELTKRPKSPSRAVRAGRISDQSLGKLKKA